MSTQTQTSISDTPATTAVEKSSPGRVLGRFKLISLIGKGGMGTVYRAMDLTLKRQVALKVFPQKITKGTRTYRLEQFIREARSAAVIEHPHVIHIYEVGVSGGWCYIAMELVEGGNLTELVKAGGPIDMVRACQLVAEAAEALAIAHKMGIVHRDVKPSNLMLTRAGRCKVTDFGLASLDDPSDPFHLPTETVGTPLYVAPEVTQGQPATFASDIYCLGATLFYLLVGSPPFTGKTVGEVLKKHRSSPLPDLRKLRPDLPEGLIKAVETAMNKNPQERYSCAEQFGRVLRLHTIPVAVPGSGSGLLSSGATSGVAPGLSTSNLPTGNKNQWAIWIGGGTGGLALLLVAIWMWQSGSKPNPQQVAGAAPVVSNPIPQMVYATPTAIPPTPLVQVVSNVGARPVIQPTPVLAPTALPTSAPPPTVAATTPLPPGVVSANDMAGLQALAKKRVETTVEGVVELAEMSPSGKIVRIYFRGNDTNSAFYVGYFDKLYTPMADKFGKDSKGLEGKKIHIKGAVKIYQGTPNIILDSPDQVTIVP